MNYWLFTVSAKEHGSEHFSAQEVYDQRMSDKFWGIGEKTKNRLQVKKGDQIVFYVAAPVSAFVGTATIASNRFKLSAEQREALSHGTVTFSSTHGVLLDSITKWASPLTLEDLKTRLKLIIKPDRPGDYIQGSILKLPPQDVFTFLGKKISPPSYQIGELYHRQNDIHAHYSGNQRSGIVSCKYHPLIFVFTGDSGEKFGYKDEWGVDGSFHYFGEGQTGDMTFDGGNKSIRDHIENGKDLLLFEYTGKGKPYRFLGQFDCIGYEFETIPDKNKKLRKGIKFQLKNVDEYSDSDIELDDALDSSSFLELRAKAYSAVKNVKSSYSSESKKIHYERNRDIKAYVLLRADGKCECCGKPAPFKRKNGTPYLEPHHMRKVSDKGMDHPRMVAAITPNCHKEIHYGAAGDEIDERLVKIVSDKEDSVDKGSFELAVKASATGR